MTAAGNNVPTYSLPCTNKKYIKINMNRYDIQTKNISDADETRRE